jgi:hypothetical protein
MRIQINDKEFNATWEKTTTVSGWNEIREWWNSTLDVSYDEDDDGNALYPTVRVETGLPQLVVVGIMYGVGVQFGTILPDGTLEALWYCPPSERLWMEVLDALRIAEHQFADAIYHFGTPRWTVME